MSNITTGRLGEQIAKDYLLEKGYQILEQNYHSHWGEIDLIVKKGDKISFIEVKTKVGTAKGQPYESFTPRKKHNLMRPIQYYLLQNNLKSYKLSLDVISILLEEDKSIEKIIHFENV